MALVVAETILRPCVHFFAGPMEDIGKLRANGRMDENDQFRGCRQPEQEPLENGRRLNGPSGVVE